MNAFTRATVDPAAIREDLELGDSLDIQSPEFMRFLIRFNEHFDADIPLEDYSLLSTVDGCLAYVADQARSRLAAAK